MKTPDFWYRRPPGLLARLLWPLGRVYQAVTEGRLARAEPPVAPLPILCVGNLVAGGSGKTPMVKWLVAAAKGQGMNAHVVSRGYGGSAQGPLLVSPALHDASLTGDEPLELAMAGCTVWVAKERHAGCVAAFGSGADLVILDDGFQSPHIARDASVLMIDGATGFGNGYGIPAGPLREQVGHGLSRASCAVILGDDHAGIAAQIGERLPIIHASRITGPVIGLADASKPVLGFCGIARPSRFEQSLEQAGLAVAGVIAFADHHPISAAEIADLRAAASKQNAQLITTAKDYARLPKADRAGIAILPLSLEVSGEGQEALMNLLAKLDWPEDQG